MFEDFIRLWEYAPDRILRFAEKWGPLRIDRRGYPLVADQFAQKSARGRWLNGRGEPLSAWRFFSRRACAVLKLAAALERGDRGSDEDWSYLASDAVPGSDSKTYSRDHLFGMPNWMLAGWGLGAHLPAPYNQQPLPVAWLRRQISGELSHWMGRYRVALSVDWLSDSPKMQIQYQAGATVLSAIALQLTLAVLKQKALMTCSGCGFPYSRRAPRKMPKAGNLNFCDDCTEGNKGSNRESQRRHREKKKQVFGLQAAGIAPAEISRQTGVRIETVEKWVNANAK